MRQQDEIIEMAKQAGFSVSVAKMWLQLFKAFAKLVAAAAASKEREACAEIVENADTPDGWDNNHIAKAIRARGETTSRGEA